MTDTGTTEKKRRGRPPRVHQETASDAPAGVARVRLLKAAWGRHGRKYDPALVSEATVPSEIAEDWISQGRAERL